MAKCPHCKKSIDRYLLAIADERNMYNFDAEGEMREVELIDRDIDYFKCPHCFEVLPDLEGDEEKAMMFLTNEDEEEEEEGQEGEDQ